MLSEPHLSKQTHSQDTTGWRVHFQTRNAWVSPTPSRLLSRPTSSFVTALDKGTQVRLHCRMTSDSFSVRHMERSYWPRSQRKFYSDKTRMFRAVGDMAPCWTLPFISFQRVCSELERGGGNRERRENLSGKQLKASTFPINRMAHSSFSSSCFPHCAFMCTCECLVCESHVQCH